MATRPSEGEDHNPGDYPAFAVTADMIVLTIADQQLQVVLIKRGGPPFKGSWALPGGFVLEDESVDAAAARELTEETGIRAAKHLEQFAVYGEPGRDPRQRVVSVAYLAILPELGAITATTDADDVALFPVAQVLGRRSSPELAFDHKTILRDAVERARSKLETTSIATAFVDPEFTLTDLRVVYETIWGEKLDPGNFRRKVLATPGFVKNTGYQAQPGPEGGKPPDLYKAGSNTLAELNPPMRRPSRS